MQLSYTYTLTGGQTALASQVMGNFSAISNVLNGNLGSDNFTTITGTLTWSISGASTLAESITTSATEGAIKITQNGILASAKSGFWITSSAAQTTGDALLYVEQTSGSSTIPAALIANTGVGPALSVVQTGVLASGKSGFKLSSTAAQTTGDALAYFLQSHASSTIPIIKAESSVGEMLGVLKNGVRSRHLFTSKTANFTAAATDGSYLVSSSGGAVTATLPAVASSTGVTMYFKKTDSSANIVTIDGASSETIDGATTFVLHAQYEAVRIYCDGAAWHVIDYSPVSGSYTPASADASNLDSQAPGTWYYTKNKNIVTFSGRVNADVTTAGNASVLDIAIPIASNFGAVGDAVGVITSEADQARGYVEADAADNRLTLRFILNSASSSVIFVSGQYTII